MTYIMYQNLFIMYQTTHFPHIKDGFGPFFCRFIEVLTLSYKNTCNIEKNTANDGLLRKKQ